MLIYLDSSVWVLLYISMANATFFFKFLGAGSMHTEMETWRIPGSVTPVDEAAAVVTQKM